MVLHIETFSNATGGNTLYKALTHPHAAALARALVKTLAAQGPVAIFDPNGAAEPFAELFGLDRVAIAGVFAQQVERLGQVVLGRPVAPVTELAAVGARTLLIAAFDAE